MCSLFDILLQCITYKEETVARSPKGQVKPVLLWSFAEYGDRKTLRLKAQGVYSCKWQGLNVDNNAASVVLCNDLKDNKRFEKTQAF